MQESGLVLSEYEEINSLLYKPIIATQRIKYTCINVSTSHIVLGSTSGSLYLFTREPCTFQQVIPLSEGTVTHVQISPDEKTVALSTKRGSVCIITFKPLAKLLSISNEHLHETVTSLCWNSKSSEIYVGDNNGKISTIVLSIFTVNGMFQAPSCALMHLDSSIVQLDYSLHYLLVSTLTRCYICDTSQEQFRQIGNKARDGAFGACFMRKPPVEIEKNTSPVPEGEKSLNKSVGLNSIVGLTDDNHEENLLIYSARPGLRLWEVNLNGTVLKTHQFKDALAVPPSEIHRSALVRSIPTSISNEQNDQNILNFSHLFVISKRYLLSHSNTCLYIIDPTNAAVVLWTDKLDTIAMAQIIDDKIYLMNANGTFHCLMLSSIDYLIIKLFEMKLYNDCYNACMTFKSDLMKLVESNNPLMVKDFNDCSNGLVTVLEPVISVIQSNFSTQPKRLNCGIVVVNSGNSIASRNNGKYERNYDSSSDSEILCKSVIKQRRKLEIKHTDDKDINDLDGEFSRLNLRKNGVESSSKINGDEEESSDPRRKQIESATASIQSDIQPIYALISTLKSSITIEDLEDTIFNIVKTIQEINFKYEDIVELKIYLYEVVRSIERLYFHGLLESVSPEMLTPPGNSDNSYVVEEVLRAFVDLNGSDYSECRCGFPRYRAPSEPKFGDVGQLLMRKFSQEGGDNCVKLCKSVPYLWRDYLRIFIDKGEKVDHLHLCLQTRDNTVLSIILPLVGDDSWDIVAECDERMRIGRCIACGRGDEDQGEVTGVGIDWSGVALEILKRQGIHAAMTFLSDVGRKLPRIKLKESIFQSLICTKLLNRHGFDQVVEFDGSGEGGKEYSSICSKKAREVLADALEKDLNRPVNNNIFGSGAHHWGMTYKTRASVCPCCTLSLQTPVLLGNSGISIFPCGHAYHVNCLIQKKLTRCYLHSLE